MKRRFKIYDLSRLNRDLRFRILITFTLLLVIIGHPTTSPADGGAGGLIINRAYASESSSSASPSASLIQKLNKLKEEIASRAAQLKSEVKKQLQNKTINGKIISKEDTRLVVSTKSGSKTAAVNDYTIYKNEAQKKGVKKPFNLSSLLADDYVILLGDIDDNNILNAKKVIKTTLPREPLSKLYRGTVVSLTKPTLVARTTDGDAKLVTNADTTINSKSGEVAFTQINIGDKVIAAGPLLKDGSIDAEFIFIQTNASESGQLQTVISNEPNR